MVITISSYDYIYFEQLIVFLTSLYTNNLSTISMVWTVGYPKDVLDELRDTFPATIFEEREVTKVDDRGIHYVLLRLEMLKYVLNLNISPAWLDTDIIIRNDISYLTYTDYNTLKILCRFDKNEDVKFNNGVMGLGCGDISVAFVDRWYNRLKNNLKWGMGQYELWNTYNEFKDKILLENIGYSYNDLGGDDRPDAFSDDSYIWHAKFKHLNNPKFKKEYNHYLAMGKQLLGIKDVYISI